MDEPLLSLLRVSKIFDSGQFRISALDDILFAVPMRETVAIVGESGSGKTTLAKIILGLEAATSGIVKFDGVRLTAKRSLNDRRRIQLVQQNPYLTLNPARTVGQTLSLPLKIHYGLSGRRRRDRIAELLDLVGLSADIMDRHPRNMSGGQRQRIALARALACKPDLLILDEPTSALDVSVQARILALLAELRSQLGLTYLFITHDLAVARVLSSKVAVLYRGQLVEFGSTAKVLANPAHPYTASLLASVPVLSEREELLKPSVLWREAEATKISEEECAFRSQCWKASNFCSVKPPMRASDADASVACYHPL
jgi:oligopeptide transport system ATP-binding protein